MKSSIVINEHIWHSSRKTLEHRIHSSYAARLKVLNATNSELQSIRSELINQYVSESYLSQWCIERR